MTRLIYTLLLCLLLPVQSWAAVAGAAASAAGSGTTSIAAMAYPATTNTGDLLVLCVSNKYLAQSPTLTVGGVWTAPSNNQGQGDPGDGPGNDVGATNATLFYKVSNGAEAGTTFGITCTSCNSVFAYVARFTNATGQWLVAAANGGDSLSGTSWIALTGTDPGILGGDMVLACSARNNTAGAASSEALTTVGVTYGTATERGDNGTSLGDNAGLVVSDHAVTSGDSAGAFTTVTFTNGANTAGGTVILRVREDAAAAPSALPSSQGFLGVIIK